MWSRAYLVHGVDRPGLDQPERLPAVRIERDPHGAEPDPDSRIVEADHHQPRAAADDTPLGVDSEEGAGGRQMLGPEPIGLRCRRRLEPEKDRILGGIVTDPAFQFAFGPGSAEGAEFPRRTPDCAA